MRPQATSDEMSCPTGQNTDSKVRRFPEAWGKNSRKSAPSTGRLPPTPRPLEGTISGMSHVYLYHFTYRQAKRAHVPIQFGPPPAARPNTPARNKVMLNARRRPTTSDAVPQKLAPMHKPKKRDKVVYRTVRESTPNSTLSCGSVRATP